MHKGRVSLYTCTTKRARFDSATGMVDGTDTVSVLRVHQSESLWKESVEKSAYFGVQGSVAPTRGEE